MRLGSNTQDSHLRTTGRCDGVDRSNSWLTQNQYGLFLQDVREINSLVGDKGRPRTDRVVFEIEFVTHLLDSQLEFREAVLILR